MKKQASTIYAVKCFIGLWVLSALTLLILPISSKFNNIFETTILIVFFVTTVSCVSILWYQNTPRIRLSYTKKKAISHKKLSFIIHFSIITSISGIVIVLLDRIFVRGIDYSLGFRAARYQWLSLGNVGSIWGKLGNLMIPFSYCALFMGIFHWEHISKKQRFLSLASGFGVQTFFAVLNGGRSNILMALIFAFTTCVMRKSQGKRFIPRIKGLPIYIGIASILLFIYVSVIFYAFTDNNLDYLELTARNLGAELNGWYFENSNPFMNTVIQIVLYLLHGIYYTGAVLLNNSGIANLNSNMSLRGILVILARLHLVDYQMELPSFDGGGGNFVALPGILIYDYGYLGFAAATILLGILTGSVLKCLNQKTKNLGIIELVFSLTVLIHINMSMIDMALGFGYFLFMVFAMVMMEIIASQMYGFSGWTKIKEYNDVVRGE